MKSKNIINSTAGRYSLAVAAAIAAALLRWVLNPLIGSNIPYVTVFPAMMIVAIGVGAGPALVTTLLGFFFAELWFIEPLSGGALAISLSVRFAILLLTSLFVGRVGERLRAARLKAEADAEALRRSEAELRQNREWLQVTLTSIGDAVITCDTEGRVTFLNPVAATLTGWKPEAALGQAIQKVFNIVNEQPGQSAISLVTRVLKEQHVVALANHTVLVAEDGKERPIEDSAAPILDACGKVTGVVLVFHDVTERRRSETRIIRQATVLEGINEILTEALSTGTEEELGRTCLNVAQEVTGSRFGFIGELNAEGRLDDIAISDPGWEACQMTNAAGQSRPPANFLIHGLYGKVIKDGKGFFTNDPATHPDRIGLPTGHPPLNSFLGAPLISHGRTIGMIAMANRAGGYSEEELKSLETLAPVIVEAFLRKRTEWALRASEARERARAAEFLAVLNAVPAAVWIAQDAAGLRLAGNQASDELLRLPAGTNVSLTAPLAERPLHFKVIKEGRELAANELPVQRAARGEILRNFEFSLLFDDQVTRHMLGNASPLLDEKGQVRGAVAAFIDITTRKQAEQRLDLLAETASELLRSSSPQQVVDALCQKVMAFLDCQVFFNFLVDPPAGRLHLNACAGIPAAEARKIEWLDYGVAVCGCAARDGCRIVAENISETPDPRTELVKSFGIQAYACHPLKIEDHLLGTLSFGTRNRIRFTDEEIALMKAVADHVAIAMDRQNNAAELQRVNADLERRVAERTQELRAKSRFLEAFYRHSLDSLVFLDKHFNFIQVNETYAKACQKDVSAFPGHNHFEFYPHPENQAIFEQVVRTRTPYLVFAKPFVFPDHPDWGITYWDWALVPVLDAQGEVDFLVLSLRDVTQRQRAEEEVRAASMYARSLLEASLDPLVTISQEGQITDVNKATELVTGRSRAELIGSDFSNYFTEPEQARAGYRQVLAEGLVRDYPLTIPHVSGRTTDVLYNATVYRNQAGQVQGVFAAARDITERKITERRRTFTNALLELFAHATSTKDYLDSVVRIIRDWTDCEAMGIRVTDEQRNIPYEAWSGFEPGFLASENGLSLERHNCLCVRTICHVTDPQDESITTRGGSLRCDNALEFVAHLTPEQQTHYRGHCMKVGFASLAVIPVRYREQTLGAIHLADHRPCQFSLAAVEFIESMSPLIGEAILRFKAEAELSRYRDHLEELVKQRTGELQSVNTHLQLEISERQRTEDVLRRTADELARSNRDLEQFAYVASHDLQEPLRAVAGYVQLLAHRFPESLDAKVRQYIDGASEGAVRMQNLISDLLAFARVTAKAKAFQPTDLNTVLESTMRTLSFSIKEACAVITADALPTLRVDGMQIGLLLQNLIGNAIKFRGDHPPRVHISAQYHQNPENSLPNVRRSTSASPLWLFSVRDNGIGIDPQYFERIFQIFQRLHTRKAYPGTGIGLAICKKIVERHGGSLWVESQSREGSIFYFALPIENNP